MKFISGANLCFNLKNYKNFPPFYNPPGARGEDTFLSTCLSECSVRKVPCYTFHDGFSRGGLRRDDHRHVPAHLSDGRGRGLRGARADRSSTGAEGRKMVGMARFERATPASRTQCPTKLGHIPTSIYDNS